MSLAKYKCVILVADCVENHKGATSQDDTLEKPDIKYFEQIYKSLESLNLEVFHISDPAELYEVTRSNCIILSIWSGTGSKFRKVTVPSICEALRIPYIGSDPYASLISQDKHLSKELAIKYGIQSAKGFLISEEYLPIAIPDLKAPLVVKPNFEGGSIGIDEKCLVTNIDEAITKGTEILSTFGGEVLIEEYIQGREISFVLAGNKDEIKFLEAVEIYFKEDPELLSNTIYSLEKKKAKSMNLTTCHRLVTDEISEELMANIKRFFFGIQKCEIIRIDGRLSNDGFKLIELTPDAHIGENATFYAAFRLKGITHADMLDLILNLS